MTSQDQENMLAALGLISLPSYGVKYFVDTVTAGSGQTNFDLSQTALSDYPFWVIVNGYSLQESQFSLSTNTIILTAGLSGGDIISIGYYYNG